ncbi:Crotonobetainyl-CoA:carnitine CoA-transferase CaiB (plasmid) [Cupriavidus taiwanensis]|uniref:Crotonobetainyl-CoA:carnitine CoA-transferase CaiB n=1 Tax=Cupriavidus taiwanensis TaxID=164546 RepID=A0A9Q7XT35_9BURK|nr:CaiB/BaiF CoA-transferase family protein [Cupriavidus taiwanensis]SPD68309.1 Crotonobetainyl-CoA:carnitine CoA-transferase CaiB [Cupriavidus taiwanensis]
MQHDSSNLPLAGLRVLDFSRILAGPTCAMVLGDLGAEVIKIEHPVRGDDTRDWGLAVGTTQTAYFNSVNRNKQSVTLDLQSAEGQRLARELVKQSDVVIQNFKFGGAEKLGLGYEQLSDAQPDLIYCSISGYDRNGPEASRPGYDLVVQGEAGLMALNGEENQPPLKFGVAAVDLFTGMYAAQAVLAALVERNRTGTGRHVEMALFDCGLTLTTYYGLEALVSGTDPARCGNAHPSIVPYGVFDAEDGPLVITVGNSSQFTRFCQEVIERPDLSEDDRFATNLKRSANRSQLLPEIRKELATRKRNDLLERLNRASIPCGEVATLLGALTSARARTSGLVTTQAHPEAGTTPVLCAPYRFDGARMPIRRAPPPLGNATSETLKSLLGIPDSQLADLRVAGVI